MRIYKGLCIRFAHFGYAQVRRHLNKAKENENLQGALYPICTLWLRPSWAASQQSQRKCEFTRGFVSDLHTLATPKLGGISTKPKKMLIFFGFVFDLH